MAISRKDDGSFTRRRFLAGSVAASIGALLVACGGAPAQPTQAPAAPTPASAAKPPESKPTEAPKPTTAAAAQPTPTAAAAKPTEAPKPTVAAAPSGAQGKKVEIRYGTFWNQERVNLLDPVLKEWTKTSGITVTAEPTPSRYIEKMLSQIAANTVPDTFLVDSYIAPKMYDQKQVLDLNPYVQQAKVDLKKDYGLMGVELWDGKTYAMPFVLSPHAWYYNKTMLKEVGAPDPWDDLKGDLTWDDMLQIGLKATRDTNGDKKTDVWGLRLDYNSIDYQLGGFIYSNGGRSHDYETMKYTLTEPKCVEAIQFVYDLVHKHKICAPMGEMQQLGQAGVTMPFQAAVVAMEEDSTGRLTTNAVNIKAKFVWDIFPIPRAKKGGEPGVPYVSGNPNSGYAKTKNPDEAWEVLNFMSGPVVQGMLSKNKLLQPGLLSAANDKEGFLKPPPDHIDVFNKLYQGKVTRRFFHQNSQEGVDTIAKWLDKIFLNEVPLEEGLKQANDEANALVKWTSKPTIQG